ncbi:hypothetical protein Psta_4051 [Pirellula staleyi DSM 6068]|uniref:Uncharacterized protein n=1 Tax=Pirellula staleyi (strain ATCC 27377 / DSM 6068 / ICPB 4128) TaxID=530564 RepID=D2R2X1_PIRSD|nr:hypothetical protein Psta_4051 [Pirellula staleyi DSM 6068]
MTAIQHLRLKVYSARRRGRLIGIAGDRESLLRLCNIKRHQSRLWTIESVEQLVGVIQGKVFDWNEGAAKPPRWKLNWLCPDCKQKQWGDWSSDVPNPCLWYSECRCIDKWQISWEVKHPPYIEASFEP